MLMLTDFLKPDVQYFDEWKGELSHSQKHKAEVFLHNNLIQYASEGRFICLPIPGYNTRTYVMKRVDGNWTCNCQGFVMKKRSFESGLSPNTPFCSHLYALHLAFKEKRFNHDV